ncbi:MAG: hypothetical protein INR65_15350, partial [Gluconacetobacter diazotrophicus]|nr:hypothetical protein [Gluconacetobacter diazotrophicus]
MNFAESLLVLTLLSVLLLQLVRRIALPYPTVLAAAGVAIALLPGTPTIA